MSGTEVSISGGNTIDIAGVNTDEQELTLTGNTLAITNGNSVDLSGFANTDNQTLLLSGTTLAISNGNAVDLDGAINPGWRLTGNANTNPSINFIGTTDDQPLTFKTNNIVSGIISSENISLGVNSLFSNALGINNIAFGTGALFKNTNGGGNIAIGYETLYEHDFSTASEYYNIAIGYFAMRGGAATPSAFTDNIAIGKNSLYNTIAGSENVALGASTLYDNFSGGQNTAVGTYALFSGEGYLNTAVGYESLVNFSSGEENTAIGAFSGIGTSGNNFCTFIGSNSGRFLGFGSYENATALGYQARVPGDNTVSIGNTSIVTIGGYASWSLFSDGRFKKNVTENVAGIDFIMKLRPVTYNYAINETAEYLKEDYIVDKEGNLQKKECPDAIQKARNEKEKIRYSGFLAQEVEAAALELNYDFSGVVRPEHNGGLYALRYSEFTVPLVKAVQEQQEIIKTLQNSIQELKNEIDFLKNKKPTNE